MLAYTSPLVDHTVSFTYFFFLFIDHQNEVLCSVVAKVMESEFDLQPCYCVKFCERYEHFYFPNAGLNSTKTLVQGLLRHYITH